MGQELRRLLYRSRSALAGTDEAIAATIARILETSQRNNARDHLSGVLLFTSSMFIQVLEGPLAAVEATFERICCDHRHGEVEILEFCSVTERAFEGWSLERVHADAGIEGLFLQLAQGGQDDAVGAASAQAISLMTTLLELGRGAAERSKAA